MLVSGLLIDMVVLIWYYFRTKVRYVPNQATILLAASRFNRTGVMTMKNISMLKFKKMCEEYGPSIFSFDIQNQDSCFLQSIELTSVFTEMSMMFNPNRICLKNNSGTICFNRVKSINYYDESQAFGMVFGIVCDNGLINSDDVVYKIIVDKNFRV